MPEFSKSVYFTRFYVIFLTNLGFELVTRKKELYNQKNGKKLKYFMVISTFFTKHLTKESKLQNDTQLHEFFQRQTNKFRQNEIFKKKTT